MAITTTILNLGDGTAVDVAALDAPTKSDYVLVDSVSETGKRESVYQKVTGSEDYPLNVRVGHYVNSKANDGEGQTNISVKISSYVEKADTDDVLYDLPCSATLAWSMPGLSGVPDASGVKELISHLFHWVQPVTLGVIQTDALDELKFGVTGNLMSHADTHS